MGYAIIRKLKLDKKNLTITMTSAENNVRDYRGRMLEGNWKQTYSTPEAFSSAVFGIAQSVLDGSYRLSPSHSLSQRISYLTEKGEIKPARKGYDSLKINDSKENRDVLAGIKKVKINKYKIISKDKRRAVRANTMTTGLVDIRKPHTTFYNWDDAQKVMDQLGDWVRAYDLSIVTL